MKSLYIILLLAFSTFVKAQTISLDSISKYIGKEVVLIEKVQGVFQTKEHKNTLLNFGKPYPNNTFTVVIFEKDLHSFSYNPLELKDKMVRITGKVVLYKDKPEIIASKEIQLVIVEGK
jgi:DNA/RNA endonuclease YhcR with UshA esterase domain